MKEPKFKIGDEVFRPSNNRNGYLFYTKGYPDIFVVKGVEEVMPNNTYAYFPEEGHGTFEEDLMPLSKLAKVLR